MAKELNSLLPGFFIVFPLLNFNDALIALPNKRVVSRVPVKNEDVSINKGYFPDRLTKSDFYLKTRYLG